MILLHAKSGAYSDYTLHPDATDAHFAKIAAETCNRAVILSRVAVLPADEASVERMMNQFQYAFNRAPVGKEIERGFAALGLTRNPQRKEK